MTVIKRDGTQQEFKENKIKDAILKAFIAVDGYADDYAQQKAENIASYIEGYYEEEDSATIEEIQDLVENGLMATKRKDVARAYITYRAERTRARERIAQTANLLKRKCLVRMCKSKMPM